MEAGATLWLKDGSVDAGGAREPFNGSESVRSDDRFSIRYCFLVFDLGGFQSSASFFKGCACFLFSLVVDVAMSEGIRARLEPRDAIDE